MKEGPDIARVAALIGDPARANILQALMGGMALTAGELAAEAGVTAATASGHLAQLLDAGLARARKQGRHRYFEIGGESVAQAIEALTGLAAGQGLLRSRPGPGDPALRAARVCYDHLAGAEAVRIFANLAGRGLLVVCSDGEIALSPAGSDFIGGLGLPLAELAAGRRPLCRACLDWSERKSHLAGALGAAFLDHMIAEGWAQRAPGSRAVRIVPKGAAALAELFPAPA